VYQGFVFTKLKFGIAFVNNARPSISSWGLDRGKILSKWLSWCMVQVQGIHFIIFDYFIFIFLWVCCSSYQFDFFMFLEH
jgi:hypothetical protein